MKLMLFWKKSDRLILTQVSLSLVIICRKDPGLGTCNGIGQTDLYEPFQTILVNHFTGKTKMRKGTNIIEIRSESADEKSIIGLDFIWLKKE